MSIIARKSSGNFPQVPAGTYPAVCVDVIELGIVERKFGGQTKQRSTIKIGYKLDKKMPDGTACVVYEWYTLSLDDRAKLRRDLEAWRGRGLTDVELCGFDLERLIGVPCLVTIHHVLKNGFTYANVE